MDPISPDDETVIDEVSAALGSFLRATDALTTAINARHGAAMCDAIEELSRARARTLALIQREPIAV